GAWVEVSPVLEQLLRAALYSFEKSGGLVNAAVLPALMAAGYDRTFDEIARVGVAGPPVSASNTTEKWQRNVATFQEALKGPPGAPAPIARLPDLLEVAPGRGRLAPGASVDLGGIAKGWIADRAVERLGLNSLVSCGGDLHARGGGETGE